MINPAIEAVRDVLSLSYKPPSAAAEDVIAAVLDNMPRKEMAKAILEVNGFDWRTSKGPRRTTTLGWVDAAISAARATLLPSDAT